MKLLVFGLVAALMAIVMAPAALIDRSLGDLSQGSLRLGQPEGTIWQGQGVVTIRDPVTQSWSTWRQMHWSFDFSALVHGWLAWHLTVEGSEPGQVAVGLAHWRVRNLAIVGPARYLVQHLDSPLAKLGWQGDLALLAPYLECSWQGVCDGNISVRWLNAGCDCLPGQVFGDYLVDAVAFAGDVKLGLSTSAGAIRIEGEAGFSTEKPLSINATVIGNPLLLSHLPAVASPWVTPTDDPGTWRIRL